MECILGCLNQCQSSRGFGQFIFDVLNQLQIQYQFESSKLAGKGTFSFPCAWIIRIWHVIESEAVAMAWRIKGQPRCPEQRSKYDTGKLYTICVNVVKQCPKIESIFWKKYITFSIITSTWIKKNVTPFKLSRGYVNGGDRVHTTHMCVHSESQFIFILPLTELAFVSTLFDKIHQLMPDLYSNTLRKLRH